MHQPAHYVDPVCGRLPIDTGGELSGMPDSEGGVQTVQLLRLHC